MLKLIHKATLREFELPPNTRIPFVLFSPFFEEYSSTTYSATMSGRSAINRELTGWQHRPGKQNNSGTLIPVILEVGGQQKHCTLNIIEADADEIKFNLLIDEGSFWVEYGDTLLNELEYNEVDVNISMNSDDVYHQKIYPEVNHSFPIIKCESYFDGTFHEEDYKEYINHINFPDDFNAHGLAWEKPVCPQYYLVEIINKIFKALNYRIHSNDLNIEGWQQLLLLNVVDNIDYEYRFTGGVRTGPFGDRTNIIMKNHIQSKTIKSFINSLIGFFNMFPIIDENSKTVKLVCLDNVLKSGSNSDFNITKYFSNIRLKTIPQYNGYQFSMTGDIPDVLQQYIINIDDIKEKYVGEITEADKLDGEFQINSIYKIYIGGLFGYKYEKFAYPDGSSTPAWILIGYENLGNIISGLNKTYKKFESEFSYLLLYSQIVVDSVNLGLVQSYNREGISQIIDANGDKNYGLILAFYSPTTVEDSLPKTRWYYPIDETTSINLIPGHENGPINTFFKQTLNMYMNKGRIYSCSANLPVNKLFTLNWDTKYQIASGTYMVKNIKGYFTVNGIEYDAENCELIEV